MRFPAIPSRESTMLASRSPLQVIVKVTVVMPLPLRTRPAVEGVHGQEEVDTTACSRVALRAEGDGQVGEGGSRRLSQHNQGTVDTICSGP